MRRRRLIALGCLGAMALALAIALRPSGAGTEPRGHAGPVRQHSPDAPGPARAPALVAAPAGSLPAAVEGAASAPLGDGGVLLGGLNAADVSTSAIVRLHAGGARRAGQLPIALHDTAAVTLGGAVYLLGGGDASSNATIYRYDPVTRAVSAAGRLPRAASDVSAVAVNGTAYVVGGYTGKGWLDTVVAWRPGESLARVVGHLSQPRRYAAVTAVGSRILIAGGTLPGGSASSRLERFDVTSGRDRVVGQLPVGLAHAAAATLSGYAYLLGGRRSALGTQTAEVLAVDPVSGRVTQAGRLPSPVSDAAAITAGRTVELAGGRSPRGTLSSITALTPRS